MRKIETGKYYSSKKGAVKIIGSDHTGYEAIKLVIESR